MPTNDFHRSGVFFEPMSKRRRRLPSRPRSSGACGSSTEIKNWPRSSVATTSARAARQAILEVLIIGPLLTAWSGTTTFGE